VRDDVDHFTSTRLALQSRFPPQASETADTRHVCLAASRLAAGTCPCLPPGGASLALCGERGGPLVERVVRLSKWLGRVNREPAFARRLQRRERPSAGLVGASSSAPVVRHEPSVRPAELQCPGQQRDVARSRNSADLDVQAFRCASTATAPATHFRHDWPRLQIRFSSRPQCGKQLPVSWGEERFGAR